jgi:hypothetical protein
MDDVPGPKGFEDVPVPALKVLLGVGKQEHENQSRYDTSGCDVLSHDCHSTTQRATAAKITTNGSGSQSAARGGPLPARLQNEKPR